MKNLPQLSKGQLTTDLVAAVNDLFPQRQKNPPFWHKDFITSVMHKSNSANSLDRFVSYASLSPSFQCYLSSTSKIIDPFRYADAINDPNWVAMNSEIKFLQGNRT